MPHVIEVFTADCSLCRTALAMVESGKCTSCILEEYNLAVEPEAHRDRVERYGVRVVPTVVIDGRIKVEGVPDFPWICGDDFYAMLEQRYPLGRSSKPQSFDFLRSTSIPPRWRPKAKPE